MENQRTIQTILSLETGIQIEADHLFANQDEREDEIFQLRTKIEEQIQRGIKDYVCLYCKQPVAIRGRKNLKTHITHFYFTHPYKSNDCIIKTDNRLTEEEVRRIKYNGVKESRLHETLKKDIAYYLGLDKTASVIVDEVYKDKAISRSWRKPDIFSIYPSKKIAFELQLSTTFLSVIVGRTIFYKERGIFLIWVFPEFSIDNDVQKFTQKDVYYNNNFNVYVFNKSAKEESEKAKELILKCYYKDYVETNGELSDNWEERYIKISDLTFDFENTDVFYYDSTAKKEKLLDSLLRRKQKKLKEIRVQITKEKVDEALSILRQFYQRDLLYTPQKNFLDEIETDEEIESLNKELKFSAEKINFVSELFFDTNKWNFLSFIFHQDKIFIDTSKLYYNGKAILEELCVFRFYDFKKCTTLLFRKGYNLTDNDKLLLKNLSKDISSKENMSKWAFINFLSSISKKEYAIDIRIIDDKILYALLSLKKGFVIGSELNNLRQVCNNFFEYRKAYCSLFIKAMKEYNQYNKLLSEDKKGKLKEKIENFFIEEPPQDDQYNEIIFEIFPELK